MNIFKNVEKIKKIVKNGKLSEWLVKVLGIAIGITTIFGFFEVKGIQIFSIVNDFLKITVNFLQISKIPVFIWLWLIVIFIVYLRTKRELDLIAGDFSDDFRKGLDKWEFGGEGWKIEYEEGEPVLSVSESHDGGIAKRGLNWRDYEFIFDTKIVNNNSGWIVRAVSRSKCLMIQLNMAEIDKPKLRFHLRIPGPVEYSWIVIQKEEIKLSTQLKLLEWINIKTVVCGCNIDIYLNGEHVAHYFIADPIRIPKQFTGEKVTLIEGDVNREVKIQKEYVPMDYWVGTVGFRCSQDEHSHFKNVRVKSNF